MRTITITITDNTDHNDEATISGTTTDIEMSNVEKHTKLNALLVLYNRMTKELDDIVANKLSNNIVLK